MAQFQVSDKFFNELGNKVKKIADEETKLMAEDMHFILKNRFPFKGESKSRYPRYDGKRYPSMGDHSFRGWVLEKRPNNDYWVANYHTNRRGFNYVNILATGKGWSDRVLQGHWSRLQNGPNGGVFSTQMPNGLDPWLNTKRGEMEENIMARIKKELR